MLQMTPEHTVLHSLCIRPDMRFENQKTDEDVLLTVRAHPITLVPSLLNATVALALIGTLPYILAPFLTGIQLAYILFFLVFVTFIYIWAQIVNWYFNIGIITNQQIIDVDFNILTFKHITRTELSHVEDVSVKSSGFISSIVDYGNVFVQTAGSEINTEFMNIPNPARAAHIIQDILNEYGNPQ